MTLWLALLPSIFKRRDAKIVLSFMIFPMLVPLLSQTLEGAKTNFGNSFLHFLEATMTSQYRLVLPVLLLSLVIVSVFKDEIDSGIMFLYKDINRTRLFRAKLFGLFALYTLYAFGTFMISLIAYYGFMLPTGQAIGQFLPDSSLDIRQLGLSLIVIVLLNLITITLVSAVSVTSKTLVAVLVGVFFSLLMMVAPLLTGIRYLAPSGYIMMSKEQFGLALCLTITLSALYLGLSYRYGLSRFKAVEF